MSITADDVRAYANLPPEVPEVLLDQHIEIAARDLMRQSGRDAPPPDHAEDWAEAHTVRALASAFPWLNTFALEGAAKVGRLEGAVEFRFLSADDVERRVKELMDRFDELVSQFAIPNPDASGGAAAGDVILTAV